MDPFTRPLPAPCVRFPVLERLLEGLCAYGSAMMGFSSPETNEYLRDRRITAYARRGTRMIDRYLETVASNPR